MYTCCDYHQLFFSLTSICCLIDELINIGEICLAAILLVIYTQHSFADTSVGVSVEIQFYSSYLIDPSRVLWLELFTDINHYWQGPMKESSFFFSMEISWANSTIKRKRCLYVDLFGPNLIRKHNKSISVIKTRPLQVRFSSGSGELLKTISDLNWSAFSFSSFERNCSLRTVLFPGTVEKLSQNRTILLNTRK